MRKPFEGDFPLTQKFGENPDIYKQFGMAGHNGLDYGTPNGTSILAFISGTIIEAVTGDAGYGNYIKIENDIEGGIVAHLQSLKVNVGDKVTEGQLIGYSDNTGFSTGPHLHWGYYKFPRDRANGYAGYIDQLPLISQENDYVKQLEADRLKFWQERDSALAQVKALTDDLVQSQAVRTTLAKQVEDYQNILGYPQSVADLVAYIQNLKDRLKAIKLLVYGIGVAGWWLYQRSRSEIQRLAAV